MTKRIIALLFSLILVFSIAAIPASAETTTYSYKLDDAGDLLDPAEEDQLNAKLSEVSENCKCNLLFVTAQSLGQADFHYNGTAEDYAKCYYNATYGANSDGIVAFLVLSDQDGDRNLCLYGTGKCEKRLSNSESEDIREDAVGKLKKIAEPHSKDYYEFFVNIADGVNKAVPPHVSAFKTILAILIGFVIAMIIMMILKGQLKTVKMERGAVNYVRPGSMSVTAARDTYLYSTVSRTARPKNNSSSSSSSGGSFSGGSTKF